MDVLTQHRHILGNEAGVLPPCGALVIGAICLRESCKPGDLAQFGRGVVKGGGPASRLACGRRRFFSRKRARRSRRLRGHGRGLVREPPA